MIYLYFRTNKIEHIMEPEIDIISIQLERRWNFLTGIIKQEKQRNEALKKIEDRYKRLHSYQRRPSCEYLSKPSDSSDIHTFCRILVKLGLEDALEGKTEAELKRMANEWYELDKLYGKIHFDTDEQDYSDEGVIEKKIESS